MKKTLIACLLPLWISFSYAQNDYKKLPFAKKKNPTYIYNQKHIGGEILFGKDSVVAKSKIKEISVLKSKPKREEDDFYNLSEHGVLFIILKKTPKSWSQARLNRFFGLKPKNDIYVDGYLLEHAKYRIVEKGIVAVELVFPNGVNKLKETVLNVWTLTKEER